MGSEGKYARHRQPLTWNWRRAVVGASALALGVAGLTVTQPAYATIGTPTGVGIAVADTDVPVGKGSFTVTWQPVTSALAYSVVAYLPGTNQIATSQSVTAPATSAVLTNLTGGQRYEVTVAAADASGYGNPSSRLTATALTVPSPPQGVDVEYDSQAQATTVTWLRPSSEGGTPILTYDVYRDGQLATSVNGNSTSASISGNYTLDRVSVRAKNAVGSSAVGSAASVPGAPRTVQATASGASVSVSWLAPLDNGGAAITGYSVEMSIGGQILYQGAPTATSTSFASVANGTYTVTVRARNSAGLGAAAEGAVTVSSTPDPSPTDPGQLPGPPTDVVAVAGDASATVTWTAPANQGSSLVTSYRVTSAPEGALCLSTTTTCIVTELTNEVTYTFTVEALNGTGFGPKSAASNAVTPTAEPTPSPTPTPADIELPARVVGVRGEPVRISLIVAGQVTPQTLRLVARSDGRSIGLGAKFTRRSDGNLKATFKAPRRPGRYTLVLRQTLQGERFVLDRSRLRVTRR